MYPSVSSVSLRGGHMRIDVPPSHRYKALLAVHAHANWGEQRTANRLKGFLAHGREKTQVSSSRNVKLPAQRRGKF